MPRQKSYDKAELLENAMQQFWSDGYEATSIDHLVRKTGVSRHGLYSEFGGKRALFLKCLRYYSDRIVSPAFARVEASGAGMPEIEAYFEEQISRAEQMGGLPGPGCLMANTMTEAGPHDEGIQALTRAHQIRLETGFQNALKNAGAEENARDLANMAAVFTQGLWSLSRAIDSAVDLRGRVSVFLSTLNRELTR